SMLEPDEVKVSRPVLRGLGAGNSPRLPGAMPQIFKFTAAAPRLECNGKTKETILKIPSMG
ncbi:MAG: hypothetical protein K8S13_25240, partial [Desulfobacula sp.]|uniref:hypothetical protein n=1 Tax=Desulfobacula sp. TaxID=2593537 RepID=UPI0025BD03B0